MRGRRAAGWLRGGPLLLYGTGGRRPRVRSSPSPELETPANNQQSTRECHVSSLTCHVSHQSSVTIIAAMVEKHSKTKYRVLPGEHGRLKFTKAPTGDSKCAEKRKNNVINNNSRFKIHHRKYMHHRHQAPPVKHVRGCAENLNIARSSGP